MEAIKKQLIELFFIYYFCLTVYLKFNNDLFINGVHIGFNLKDVIAL